MLGDRFYTLCVGLCDVESASMKIRDIFVLISINMTIFFIIKNILLKYFNRKVNLHSTILTPVSLSHTMHVV